MLSVKYVIRNIHSKYEKLYLKEIENNNFNDNYRAHKILIIE
jgi:hypothetical protein